MRAAPIFIALFCCATVSAQNQHSTVRAELIWVNSNADESSLMFSQLTDQEWSTPVAIYSSDNYITTPTISTDIDGNKFIIWSEQSDKSTVLMSTQRSSSMQKWRQAEKINDLKAENLSPSVVVDVNNQLWVFWSSNSQGLDDIYYSRQQSSAWSKPEPVHASNEVPDIQPVASLNQDLDLVVEWQTYDLESGQYLTTQRLFTFDKASKSRYRSASSKRRQESVSDVDLPDFLPQDSAVGLHFPNNRSEQSVRLDLY